MVADDHQQALTFAPPSWGPDRALVYESRDRQLTRLERESGAPERLTAGRFPSWSPDGRKIMFRRDSGQVCVYELASGSEREAFGLRLHQPNYLWTPDSAFVLVGQRVHNSRLENYYVYDVDAGVLLDLRVKADTLDGRLIEVLPAWLDERLQAVVPP